MSVKADAVRGYIITLRKEHSSYAEVRRLALRANDLADDALDYDELMEWVYFGRALVTRYARQVLAMRRSWVTWVNVPH